MVSYQGRKRWKKVEGDKMDPGFSQYNLLDLESHKSNFKNIKSKGKKYSQPSLCMCGVHIHRFNQLWIKNVQGKHMLLLTCPM